MNLKDRMNSAEKEKNIDTNKRSSGSNSSSLPDITPRSNVSQMDLVQKQQELIQQQESTIQTLQFEKQKLADELVSSNEKIVKLSEENVTLNGKLKNLSQSDKELSESIRIRDAAAKEREKAARDLQNATWERETAEEQNRKNREEGQRLSEWKFQLQREQRSQSEIVQQKVEREMERKKKEISLRIAKEWYSSVMLIVYSLFMTLYFIVTHWETVLTGDVFFTRLVKVIKGIWEVAWPAVYGYWFRQFHSDTGSLIATIVTALLAAGIIFGIIILFRKWRKAVDKSYDANDHRKQEAIFLIILAALVFSLIVCERIEIKMTWIMLWFITSFGIYFGYQTIRLLYRRRK